MMFISYCLMTTHVYWRSRR